MRPLELSDEQLQQVLADVSARVTEWLRELPTRRISPDVRGPEVEALFGTPLPEQGEGLAALERLNELTRCSRAQNGRFVGYVLGSAEPVAVIADLLASALNQNLTAWRSGPAAVTIEKAVISSLASAIRCPEHVGSLTGGGSSANLMGLAMAREAKLSANETGVPGNAVLYASTEVHMSIPKAVALLGVGRQQLRMIPVDERFRIRVDLLEQAIEADLRDGKRPFAIVGSAGTVNTGSVDPLDALAELAARHGLWFHVDGAYGALSALAAPERLRALSRADSLSLDAHKWLYQPLDCGVLLYRSREIARATFSFTGDYTRALSEDPIERFSFFEESAELSRRFRALKLWLSWRFHGLAAFRAAIARDLQHAQQLAGLVSNEPRLELLAPVELSAVCFRLRTAPGDVDLDAFNAKVLAALNARGRVYLSNATIQGRFALRACFTNHRTTEEDVAEILREVLATAELVAQGSP
jgi:glutamate/tyrosine decarboxylase-like PLP-dependent enzyme